MKKCFVKILSLLLTLIMLIPLGVSAQNPYGFNDEIMEFLNEKNVDVSIFLPIFNYNENPSAEVVKPVENRIYEVRGTAYSYGWTDIQVQQMLEGYINTTLKWMHIEYAYLPKCRVTLNGQEINNTYREYPLLQYRDIVYFPLTYYDMRFLGVSATWHELYVPKLIVKKANINEAYHDYPRESANEEKYPVSGNPYVSISQSNIDVNGKKVVHNDETYPFLSFREIIYFPLTWEYAVDEFGWEYSYDDENGLVINSAKDDKIPEAKEKPFRVIGYYSGDLFDEPLENLQTDKLTHIMYAFLIPQKDGTCVPFENPDKVKALVEKAHNDGCKVYIAIGGWSYQDVPLVSTFETVSANDSLRQKFIGNIMDIVDEYNFDGVELDWEYPSKASEKNYEKLILELHEKLREKDKCITAALNGAWSATQGPEVSNYVSEAVLDAFEFINVMSYDMNNEQHSPFWFANTSIDYWLTRGVAADKIVLGMPLYARPTFMQYRHLVAKDKSFAYNDYAVIDGTTSHYNGLPTLCKKTILAAYKAGGVMLFDVNEDTNDNTSIVSMIDYTIEQIEKDGFENIGALSFLSHTSVGIDDLLEIIR